MGRAAVFIDGANLFYTQRHLGWQIDFSRLMAFFMTGYASVEANYYVPASEPVSEENAAFTRVLTAQGYRIISKPVKKIVNKETGEVIMKGNLDVELVVDALIDSERYDTFMLFSGDSDFLPLLRALKEKGKEVIVYSTQGLSARELLAEPNVTYCDLSLLRDRIGHLRSGDTPRTDSASALAHGGFPARLPDVGEHFTGTVLKVKPYGVFLSNPYHVKCLLPLSFLGVSHYIRDLTAIVRMSDVFEVTVFHVNKAKEIPEITVKLIDNVMVEELASRTAG
ncbi:NYN domain-containing protein [Chlorobium sp. KB01]|uniref:NYN domain-containing protein n=1 Tax=Chlorobium sp. KB01 TaxID=1917528 RepID=UPI0009774594|nr:NYN domain-containing protein [Chlorobium sp. KB01]